MTTVKAMCITSISHSAVSDWLEGFTYTKLIYVGDPGPVVWVDMDFIDAQVGDWVVFWPSSARITYSAEGFNKHFTHIEAYNYETPWTPLFNAANYSRSIIN